MPPEHHPPPDPEPTPQLPAERFRELRAVCARLERGGQRAMAAHFLPLVDALERVHDLAVHMREGSESFDNRGGIEMYREVQLRVLAATWEATEACEVLAAGTAGWKGRRPTPPPAPPPDSVGAFGS